MGRILLILAVFVFILVIASGLLERDTGSAPAPAATPVGPRDPVKPPVHPGQAPRGRQEGAAQDPPPPDPGVDATSTGLIGALAALLTRYAEFDHSVQEVLWAALTGPWRVLLGALKCLSLVLIIFGLMSFGLLGRAGRRWL